MDTGVNFTQILFSFVFVVALIGLLGWALRKFGMPEKWLGKAKSGTRVNIIETCYLDPRRKLVLVRRDNTEHLILLAPDAQMLIETIARAE